MEANMSWVTDTLATGGDLSYDIEDAISQVEDIVGHNVALVIDCRKEASDQRLWDHIAEHRGDLAAPSYLYLPTDDSVGHHIPADLFDKAVAAALPVLNSGHRVFVHCHMGVNRGPSVAFALLLAQGWEPVDALDAIKAGREQAGLAYAEDALIAHHRRNDVAEDQRTKELQALRARIREVWTPQERQRIGRIIRNNHQDDNKQYLEAVMKGSRW